LNNLDSIKSYSWEWNNKKKKECNSKAMISNSISEITWEGKVYGRYEKFYCNYFDDTKRKQIELEEKENMLREALQYKNKDSINQTDLFSLYHSV
jgi:hypothetical protein